MRLLYRKVLNASKGSLFNFCDSLTQNGYKKVPEGPFFRFFGTMRLSECSVFVFSEKFRKICSVSKESPFFFWYFATFPSQNIKKMMGTLWSHSIFLENVSQCRKTGSVDAWGFFNISDGMHQENWMGVPMVKNIFRRKVPQSRKNWKEGPSRNFKHSFYRKTLRNLEGTFRWKNNSEKKSECWNKLKGGHFSLALNCYGKKRKNLFASVR